MFQRKFTLEGLVLHDTLHPSTLTAHPIVSKRDLNEWGSEQKQFVPRNGCEAFAKLPAECANPRYIRFVLCVFLWIALFVEKRGFFEWINCRTLCKSNFNTGIFMLELCIAHETPMIVNHAPFFWFFVGKKSGKSR